MQNVPLKISSEIPFSEIANVENWWEKLNEEDQEDLKELYEKDQLNDSKIVSIYLCGKFVEQDKNQNNNIFWVNHFYDYIVNHEMVIDEYKVHHGGICSATKAAEEAVKKGMLSSDFECPIKNCKCQMRQILNLNKKKNLKLYLKFKIKK